MKFKLFLFLLFFSFSLSAQDIKFFFRILPPEYLDSLDRHAKDSLLVGKAFYPSTNDSLESVVYNMEELDLKKNFLRVEMTFTTGQAAYVVTELRNFKTKTGSSILIISKYSGAHQFIGQNVLDIFSFDKQHGLKETSLQGLIKNISIKYFLKRSTPDSVAKQFEDHSSIVYELGYEGKNITLKLTPDFDIEEQIEKWLLGNTIEFIWDGTKFIRQKPHFKE